MTARRMTEEQDDQHRAAGILPISISTGKMLMGLRHSEKFSTIGGFACVGEKFSDAAIREFIEETNYKGQMFILKGYHYQDPVKNFEYANYVGVVPREFKPMLDQENLGAEWLTLSQVYSGQLPLHPGCETFLWESKPLIMNLMHSMGHLNE